MKARVQEDFTRMSVGASFWVLRTNVEDHHFFLLSLVHCASGKLDCCVAECGLRRGNATWYRLVYACMQIAGESQMVTWHAILKSGPRTAEEERRAEIACLLGLTRPY